jgi:hypothetical protein
MQVACESVLTFPAVFGYYLLAGGSFEAQVVASVAFSQMTPDKENPF